MLTYDNHVEVRLIENKKPEPEKSDVGVVITVGVTVTLAITLTLSFAAELPGKPPSINPYWEEPEQSEEDKKNSGEEMVTPIPKSTPFALVPGQRVRIDQCNGVEEYDGANFRDYPALTPVTIRGVVPEGDWVTIMSEKIDANGISWYQVVNLSRLSESDQPNVQHDLEANQMGWIAACFVE